MEAENEEESRRDRVRGRLLGSLPKGGKAAEIGVWEGNFSERILEIAQPSELHLIDPWLYQPEFGNTGFGRKKNENRMDEMFREVSERFADDPRVRVHRSMSKPALESFPDAYFDWVYIDGNHTAPYVREDLDLSRRKVRPGGLICGDDFNWNAAEGAPVKTSVEALVAYLGPEARLRLMANQYIIHLPG